MTAADGEQPKAKVPTLTCQQPSGAHGLGVLLFACVTSTFLDKDGHEWCTPGNLEIPTCSNAKARRMLDGSGSVDEIVGRGYVRRVVADCIYLADLGAHWSRLLGIATSTYIDIGVCLALKGHKRGGPWDAPVLPSAEATSR